MSIAVEQKLYDAAHGGDVLEVESLLKDYPDLNVNWGDVIGWTSLHIALYQGCVEVVKVLLAHPDINVNVKNEDGATPWSFGCLRGQVSVVQVLLKDPRVDATLEDIYGCTPLWWASFSENLDMVECLIAGGTDLGDIDKKIQNCTAINMARHRNKTDVVSLLERFVSNPAQTRHEVHVKLGVLDALAAEVFALAVFLCDGLLQLKPALNPVATPNHAPSYPAAATRFFSIASKLPMELQMMLCHRVVGSMKQNILHKDSEPAFKHLAEILLPSSQVQ